MGGTTVRPIVARLAVVTALVVAAGWTSSTAGAARTPKPTVTAFAAVPTTVTGPSGYVHLSAVTTGATSCAFTTTTAGATFTPTSVPCSSGTATTTLFVSENNERRPVTAHLALAATGPGGTRSARLSVPVDPGAGGRSVPGAPSGAVATASDGSASVTVAPPVSDGGEPVVSYAVTAIDLSVATHGGQTASGASGGLTVAGLVDGDAYRFVATASNLIGAGPPSVPSNPIVPDPVPGTPTAVSAVAGDQQATVSFLPPGSASADSTYQVAATDLTASGNGGQTASGGSSPVTVSGLTDGDRYVFTVQAMNARGSGPLSAPSDPVMPELVPGTPTGVTAVAGDGQAVVSFVPPADAGPSTDYLVTASDHTDPSGGGQTATGDSPVTVTGLTDGDTYTFTVTAVDGTVDGTVSLPSNAVVPTVGDQADAGQAVEDGQDAYLAALNANPDLAQCNTGTNGSGTCSGIDYGQWIRRRRLGHRVLRLREPPADLRSRHPRTDQPLRPGRRCCPRPLRPPTTTSSDSETINLKPANGFLPDVWWSNFESYNPTGNYSGCTYNWQSRRSPTTSTTSNSGCPGQIFFGPVRLPVRSGVHQRLGVRCAATAPRSGSPSFGDPTSGVAQPVMTADPNCLFVDVANGMYGSATNCSAANGDVHLYDTANSSDGNAVEPPPQSDCAARDHRRPERLPLLGSDPDQPQHRRGRRRVGQMTVISPDTVEVRGRPSAATRTPGTTTTSRPTPTTAPTTAPRRSRPTVSSSSRTPPRPDRRFSPGPTPSTTTSTTRSPI